MRADWGQRDAGGGPDVEDRVEEPPDGEDEDVLDVVGVVFLDVLGTEQEHVVVVAAEAHAGAVQDEVDALRVWVHGPRALDDRDEKPRVLLWRCEVRVVQRNPPGGARNEQKKERERWRTERGKRERELEDGKR